MSQREAERRSIQSQQDKSLGKHAYRRWVSANSLAIYYDVTPKTIWAWAKSGKLPQPQKIGPNCTRWDLEEIQAKENAA